MLTTAQNAPNGKYAIDDPEIFAGDMEIYIAPPFDNAHVINIMRQMKKHKCRFQYSSGSHRDGCLIAVYLDEPQAMVSILADTPGINDVRITPVLESKFEQSHGQSRQLLMSGRMNVHRITVTVEPRKVRAVEGGREGIADGQNVKSPAHKANETGIFNPERSTDSYSRRVTFDARGGAFGARANAIPRIV
ncbi:MAG: hypothetical protein PHV74_00700 [Dehalococcoidia bacterium]|nr:hypothetical protein [Dehalococcoidia bacterium]